MHCDTFGMQIIYQPYRKQGDATLNSEEVILARAKLFDHPRIREWLDCFWCTFTSTEAVPVDDDGSRQVGACSLYMRRM